MDTSICELRDADEARLVGGKGANLGRLLRLGYPVPPGFVVTTAA
jgi:phosphoenolpyruvate synthase/pyruvate phosphate dikinase